MGSKKSRSAKKWTLDEVRSELVEHLPPGWNCPDSATLEQAAELMISLARRRITIKEEWQLLKLLNRMGMTPAARNGFIAPSDEPN
jgi:hypothetical protein